MTRTYKRSVWHNSQTSQHDWKRKASAALRRIKKNIEDTDYIEPTKRDVKKYNPWTSPKESIYGAFIRKKIFYSDSNPYGGHKRHTFIFTIGRELPHKKHYRKYVEKRSTDFTEQYGGSAL